jgi:hypothetical protein
LTSENTHAAFARESRFRLRTPAREIPLGAAGGTAAILNFARVGDDHQWRVETTLPLMIVATFVDVKLETLPGEAVVTMQLNESAGDPW